MAGFWAQVEKEWKWYGRLLRNHRGCHSHRWLRLPGTTFDESELVMIDGFADGENGWQQAWLRAEQARREAG